MRVLWATCGLAVAASALTGVLVGVYIDGMDDGRKAEPPASTWITSRPASSSATTGEVVQTSARPASGPSSSPTTRAAATTTTTAVATKPATPTTQAPPPATTTTKVRSTEWPCSPLNPLPPPSCDD